MAEQIITLGNIWADFFEVIRKDAGHGKIVEISRNRTDATYIAHDKTPSKPGQVRILFTHALAERIARDETIAGRIINGTTATKKNGTAAAVHDVLEFLSVGQHTCLEAECAHIESVMRKTLAVKLFFANSFNRNKKISENDVGEISVSERDFSSLCNKLLDVFQRRYVSVFADDERYAWLFNDHDFNDCNKVPQYLTALICVAIISIPTEPASAKIENERSKNRDTLRNNISKFLFNEKKSDPSATITYYEALWKNFYRGIVRDQVTTATRELIDFYVLPEIISVNGTHLENPLSDLTNSIYVTAGSGFGKTTLLHIALLVSIIDTLIAEHSGVISANSLSKASEYRAIRYSLFGDTLRQYFPVFIHSSSANNTNYGSILDLAEAHTVAHFKDMVDSAHNAGTLLLMIDSLDEVENGKKMDSFIKGVNKLLAKEYPRARVIFTSRFLGRMQLPFECKTIHVAELNDEAIQKITKAVLSHRSAAEVLELLTGLKSNKYLTSLARNPFMLLTMLEEKKDRHLHQILESIVNAIIERRWDAINRDISAENIKMLLGYLACNFVFGNLSYVLRTDIEKAFYKAEESLRHYKIDINIPSENMDRFLRVLSCQSGILNITYQHHVEKFVFQDNLVMCWLAAHYVSRILIDAIDAGIEDRNNEASLWSNAIWLDKFIRSFTHKRCNLSADGVSTLVISLVTCSKNSGEVLQESILYYFLFKDAVSLSATEKNNIAEGYQAIIDNTFGENDIANHPESDGRRLICSATNNHKIV